MGNSEITRKIAVHLAHPFLDLPSPRHNFSKDELDSIYDFLRKNRVILRAMNYAMSKKDRFSVKSSFLEEAIQKSKLFAQTYVFASRLKQKIVEVSKALIESGVCIVFIKSFDEFPLDSHNFDILVKEKDITFARTVLVNLGFKELLQAREPFKWFYRKVDDNIVVSVHLHTKIGWEGVEFVDSDNLWNNYREIESNGVKIGFLSSEHHLLTTVAHAFFENRSLNLSDLIYIVEALQSSNGIDWDYIIDWCVADHWFKAFYDFLQLADYVYRSFYGEQLVEGKVFRMLAKKCNIVRDDFGKKLIYHFDKRKNLPMKIPDTDVAFSFIKKVLNAPDKSFVEKMGKVSSSGWHYIKRKISLKKEFPTFLICFSGQDGTGKTTNAEFLLNEFRRTVYIMNDELAEKNLGVKYVWSRGIGATIDPLLRIVRWLLLGSKFQSSGEYVSKRGSLLNMKPIKNLWAYVMLIDELLQLLIKVKIPLLFRQNVVCDRYIYDALVDVECDLGKSISKVLKKIFRDLSPKPRITFIMDAQPREILRRKKGLELEVIKCKRETYLTYLGDERSILVNTEKSLRENKRKILSVVLKTLMVNSFEG